MGLLARQGRLLRLALLWVFFAAAFSKADAGDWPMWRANAQRGAAIESVLPEQMHLQWAIALPTPQPAWPPDQGKLQFDASYEPVVVGQRMFVPSMASDHVTAYDTRTGKQLWRFFAEGPVRFAPVATAERVYFTSDDGYLYCVAASDGKLLWKFRGGPDDRKVIGNDRIVSAWPARGGPVMHENAIYFAASIWPFMGTFIHAVDAQTGKALWTNSGSGANYMLQPHSSPAFANVAPQGYLAISDGKLIVPGGRSTPAVYDLATGAFLHSQLKSGSYDLVAGSGWVKTLGAAFSLEDGSSVSFSGGSGSGLPIVFGDEILQPSGSKILLYSDKLKTTRKTIVDRKGKSEKITAHSISLKGRSSLPSQMSQVFFKTGNRIYGASRKDVVMAAEPPKPQADAEELGPAPKITWQAKIRGEVWRMLAADDRLFVVSREGEIFCFGAEGPELSLENLPSQAGNQVSLIEMGAKWRVANDVRDYVLKWREADFDDARWTQQTAEIQYGEPMGSSSKGPSANKGESSKEEPVGSEGEKAQSAKALAGKKFITTYFRREFIVPEGGQYSALSAKIKMEDGAVVYLNGQEAARLFMPTEEVKPNTPATSGGTQSAYHLARLDPELLRPGKNVIAVEVHLSGRAGDDPTFDLQLLAAARERVPSGSAEESPASITARRLLALRQAPLGYVVLHGGRDAALIRELAVRADQQVIVLESDPRAVASLRKEFTEQELYGDRITVLEGDLTSVSLPPYLAALVVYPHADAARSMQNPAWARRLLQTTRPYGGTVVLTAERDGESDLTASLKLAGLEGFEVERHENWTALHRRGALPGSAPWTHQNADAGNSLISRDTLVKAPLGLLWFGGPSNEEVLPRHGHGPSPQVLGGRLIIEGTNMLRAVDVYTGRKLWQRGLPGLGDYYNNTAHQPGANAIGSNYCLIDDSIYVAYGRKGLRLDIASGETRQEFELPADESGDRPYWGYIGVRDDLLIAGSSPVLLLSTRGRSSKAKSDAKTAEAKRPDGKLSTGLEIGKNLGSDAYVRHAEGCRRLVVMDRRTGKPLWSRDALYEFRHNSIIVGGDLIYCIDGMTTQRLALLARRGIGSRQSAILYALDSKTGRVVWSANENVFGTWLGYSSKHNLVLQAGSKAKDRAADEAGEGMVAYEADTGKVLWEHDEGYGGPPLMADDMIVTQGDAYSYETGKRAERKHPMTDETVRWQFKRNYGCNTAIGCTNLLTFRSAAAGYFNLENGGGTGNIGGFRSSCTSNLIPADGILNAPDYTRTCTCSYQNQCSLALIHMPENEEWTFNALKWNGSRIQRAGINFGAPGDRRSETGTLWLDYPSVGGNSPDLPIKVEGKPQTVRMHSSLMESPTADAGKIPAWVVASNLENVGNLEISLGKGEANEESESARYTVRLYFAELADTKPGERVFSIKLQNETREEALDVVAAAGGPRRGIVKEYRGVEIGAALSLSLKSAKDKTKAPILSGIELIREKSEK